MHENTQNKAIRKITRRVMRYVDYYHNLRDIRKKELTFDLVHTNTGITDLGFFLARHWNVPHVWHSREFGKEDYGLEDVLSKRRVAQKYRRTDCVIAILDAIQKKLESKGQNLPIVRIYDGIQIGEPYQKEYIKVGILKFCIAGSIFVGKRQLDVVKACQRLREMGYREFELYIVGSTGGEYYRLLKTYIKE